VIRRSWRFRSSVVGRALLLAAVGLAGIGATKPAGAQAARNAPGVSASAVTVAGLGYSASYLDAQVGAQARFDVVNQGGGVRGRRIEFAGWSDDKGDPATDLAAGRKLAADRQVLAVVPAITPTFSAAPVLAGAQLPSFGWGLSTGFCANPYAFAITGCIAPAGTPRVASSAWGRLLDVWFASHGQTGAAGKTAAVIAEAGPAGREATQLVAASAKAAGLRVVYQQATIPPPPAVVVDDAPYAGPILAADGGRPPDVVFLVVSFPNVIGLAGALGAAHYPGVITSAVGYDPTLASVTTGQLVLTGVAVPEAAPTNPAMATIVARIQAVNGGEPVGLSALAGYFSADFFVAALRHAGANPTPASVARAAAHLRYEIPGVVGPTSYPGAQQNPTPCGSLVESTGSAYQVAVPYSCFATINITTGKVVARG
jgi:ABC-type branched-subunit amino acid transport system substrate-binding protein